MYLTIESARVSSVTRNNKKDSLNADEVENLWNCISEVGMMSSCYRKKLWYTSQ